MIKQKLNGKVKDKYIKIVLGMELRNKGIRHREKNYNLIKNRQSERRDVMKETMIGMMCIQDGGSDHEPNS